MAMRMTTSFEINSSKYKARTVFFQMHEEKKMKKGSFGGRRGNLRQGSKRDEADEGGKQKTPQICRVIL